MQHMQTTPSLPLSLPLNLAGLTLEGHSGMAPEFFKSLEIMPCIYFLNFCFLALQIPCQCPCMTLWENKLFLLVCTSHSIVQVFNLFLFLMWWGDTIS